MASEFAFRDGNYSQDELRNPTTPQARVASLNWDIKSSEWVLAPLRRQWLQQIIWYYGEQYLEYSPIARRFISRPTRQYIPRSLTNHIMPKVEIGVALLMDAMPDPKFTANTTEDRDRDAAEVAGGIFRYKDEQIRMTRKKRALALWTVCCGNAFAQVALDKAGAPRFDLPVMKREIRVVTDEDTGEPITDADGTPATEIIETPVIDPETQQPMTDRIVMADENVEVCSPFEIIPDWNAKEPWEMKRYTHFRPRTRDWLGATFGSDVKKKVKPERSYGTEGYYQFKIMDLITRSSATDRLGLISGGFGGSGDIRYMEDSAVVITRYHLPTDDNPDGKIIVCAGDWSAEFSYEEFYGDRLNLYTLRWSYLPGSIYGFGMVRNLIIPQKRLNGIDTQDDLIRKQEGNPQWLVPKRCQFSRDLGTSEPGHVNTYRPVGGLKPERLPGTGPHPSLQQTRANILADFEILSGVNDVLRGENPTGVTAGVSLELLVERAAKRFQPAVEDFRDEYRAMYEHRALVAQRSNAWKWPRPVPIVGDDGLRELRHFAAVDFTGNYTVEVEAVPITARSQVVNRQNLETGVKLGLVDVANSPQSRDRARLLFGLSQFDEAYSLDYRRAQEENEAIMADQPIKRGPFDDDEVHVAVHTTFAKSRKWKSLTPEQQKALINHVDKEHIPRLMPSVGAPAPGAPDLTPGDASRVSQPTPLPGPEGARLPSPVQPPGGPQ